MDNRQSSLTILAKAEDGGTAVAAGEMTKQYLSASDDSIVPKRSPGPSAGVREQSSRLLGGDAAAMS